MSPIHHPAPYPFLEAQKTHYVALRGFDGDVCNRSTIELQKVVAIATCFAQDRGAVLDDTGHTREIVHQLNGRKETVALDRSIGDQGRDVVAVAVGQDLNVDILSCLVVCELDLYFLRGPSCLSY